jgi:predicted TIM-barrel fold metal-dependent hydrolase
MNTVSARSQAAANAENKLAQPVIDSDGHIRETDEQIMEYMSPAYRARRSAILYSPLVPHHGWPRAIPLNDSRGQDFRVPDWREWSAKLDEGQIEFTVLYPTKFMHIGQVGSAAYADELCRAYNNYLNDQFLRHDKRMKGMALIPMQDVAAAVTELRRVIGQYPMVGAVLPADGLPLPLGHPLYRPVFEEADRLGCALAIHACNSLRDNDRYLHVNEAATLAHVIPQMRQFASILYSGILGDFSQLRLGFLEAGSGWVPYLVEKIEDRLERLPPSERPPAPSELLRHKRLYFQCGEEKTTARDLELMGDDCLMWASDFPHEGTKTRMDELITWFFARDDIPAAAKRKITYDNAKRFYRL